MSVTGFARLWLASAICVIAVESPAASVRSRAIVGSAANSQVVVDGVVTSAAFNIGPSQAPFGAVSRSSATGDLRSGKLQAFGQAVNKDSASADVFLTDVVSFVPTPGGSPTAPPTTRIVASFEGLIDVAAAETGESLQGTRIQESLVSFLVRATELAGPGSFEAEVEHLIRLNYAGTAPSGGTVTIFDAGSSTTTGGDGVVNLVESSDTRLIGELVLEFPFTPGALWNLDAHLVASAVSDTGRMASTDFSQTASLAIELPEGYTFTSESGLLLTVPSPGGTCLLFIAASTWCVRRERPPRTQRT